MDGGKYAAPPQLPGINWQVLNEYADVPNIESWNWGCPACGQKNYYRKNDCRQCKRQRVKRQHGVGPRGGVKLSWFMRIDWVQ